MTTKMPEETMLKLTGLRVLADDCNKQLAAISRAAAELVSEDLGTSEYGHASDFAYDSKMSPAELWERTIKFREKDAV